MVIVCEADCAPTAAVNALSNGDSLSLAKPGTVTSIFTAIASLSVIKDQSDFAGSAGSADSSVLGNAFSVTIPEPATWAMMLLGFVGLGYAAVRRGKKGRSALAI